MRNKSELLQPERMGLMTDRRIQMKEFNSASKQNNFIGREAVFLPNPTRGKFPIRKTQKSNRMSMNFDYYGMMTER